MNQVDVIIVGAGMAGLTAAARLEDRGVTTIVLDKGRAPGGRMATRRIGEASFDHGAQHFSARSAEFRKQTAEWIERGVVEQWFSSPSRTVAGEPIEPRHIGLAGMRRIPESIAADLRVETSVAVERIEQQPGGVAAVSSEGKVWPAAGMILTPPAPQSLQLLGRSGVQMSDSVGNSLATTESTGRWICTPRSQLGANCLDSGQSAQGGVNRTRGDYPLGSRLRTSESRRRPDRVGRRFGRDGAALPGRLDCRCDGRTLARQRLPVLRVPRKLCHMRACLIRKVLRS